MGRTAEVISDHIHGNTKQPCGQFRITAEACDGTCSFYKGLLSDVGSVIRVINIFDNEAVKAALMLGDELPEERFLI